MKLIYTYITCLMFIVTSCDYLDIVPDNVITEDYIFQDRYTTERFLATCYYGLPRHAGFNENPAILGGMEMVIHKDRTEYGMLAARGLDSPANAYINIWNGYNNTVGLFWAINDCNTFLSGVGKVKDLKPEEKDRMIAEVKMLKAYLHFYLMRYYGPITPLRENYSVDLSTANTRMYREKIDDTFQYLLTEMQEVIDSNALPLIINNRATELGRFTQPAAHMLKAKMLLYWASPLFNGNSDYNAFKDHNGEPFFNQNYDATRWAKATEACKKAIEVSLEANHRLYLAKDYTDPRKMSDETMQIQTLRGAITDVWNVELIWGNTPWWVGSHLQCNALPFLEPLTQASWAVSMNLSVPLSVAETFYSKNGVPIHEDIEYDYEHRYELRTGDDSHKYYIKQGEKTVGLNFDREPRFYATLGFDRGVWYGNSSNGYKESNPLYVRARIGEPANKNTRTSYNLTGYFPKKIVSINTAFYNPHEVKIVEYPYPEMRYADLLLMYAEALNESKEIPDSEVYNAIDEVRARAGLKGVVESWKRFSNQPDKPLTQAGMREIIRQERRNEFACEGVYFWDSHRWKTAIKEQNGLVKGWNINGATAEEYYTPVSVYVQTFSFKNYFAPIPESDIIKNPNLIQNPGW